MHIPFLPSGFSGHGGSASVTALRTRCEKTRSVTRGLACMPWGWVGGIRNYLHTEVWSGRRVINAAEGLDAEGVGHEGRGVRGQADTGGAWGH